jgi:transcriptional regulator with XRE-family HTH domain
MTEKNINRIKTLRESMGLSQDYVAGKLEITQQAYSKIESSPDTASLKRLRDLSEVLGVTLTSIIGEDDTYILQNFHQQGGNASTVMYLSGITEKERAVYENHISDLKNQVEWLREMLQKDKANKS